MLSGEHTSPSKWEIGMPSCAVLSPTPNSWECGIAVPLEDSDRDGLRRIPPPPMPIAAYTFVHFTA